ncbi:hypothetical protein MMC09_000405 [Bachmanniomyces sp. S44760]|nr:hypothetical protein [Bachmanniomyces sp. S44760]
MACVTNGPCEDGATRSIELLASLEEEDPLEFDRSRRQYSEPPPPYTSMESSKPGNLEPSSERQEVYKSINRGHSDVYWQFLHQEKDEENRLRDARSRGELGNGPYNFKKVAQDIVKKRWIEQGIWNSKWGQLMGACWKHEEPLELESESESASESDSELEDPPGLFGVRRKKPKPPKPRHSKSDAAKREIAERRIIREREREASRPHQQFEFQVAQERKSIEDDFKSQNVTENGDSENVDINLQAYLNVKNRWIMRGIWSSTWGNLPGNSWMHEKHSHLTDSHSGEPPPFNESHTTAQALPENRPCLTPNDGMIGVHHTATEIFPEAECSASNSSGRGEIISQRSIRTSPKPSARTEASRSKARGRERFPASPEARSNEESIPCTSERKLRSNNRSPQHKDNKAPPEAALRAVHSSKVSKTSRKGKPRALRGPSSVRRLSFDSTSPSSWAHTSRQNLDSDTAQGHGVAANNTLRRSARIARQKELQSAMASNAPIHATNIVPVSAPDHPARSKSKRHLAGEMLATSSAKPHGISKTKSKKPKRQKARK